MNLRKAMLRGLGDRCVLWTSDDHLPARAALCGRVAVMSTAAEQVAIFRFLHANGVRIAGTKIPGLLRGPLSRLARIRADST